MGDSDDYSFKQIRGVNVIVWSHTSAFNNMDKQAKKRRKHSKDTIGQENVDVSMLDVKQSGRIWSIVI